MNVWRIHLKPLGVDPYPFQFCIANNIIGVGWPLDVRTDGISLEEYEANYGMGDKSWRTAINAVGHDMDIGDFVWTRDNNRIYYLGRIISVWFYCGASEEYSETGFGSARRCEWRRIEDENIVPVEVVDSFDGQTVECIHINADAIAVRSQEIYLTGR
jgi:hypothetical protein